jgi:cold shock protein
MTGVIKELVRASGYGFIESEDGHMVFFHQRWLKKIRFRDLNIGDEMAFLINDGPRGPRAFNLHLASDEEEIVRRPVELLFKD